jgi:hypothetical protein
LPDGAFANQKDIWDILRPIGVFCGHLVYFNSFWNVVPGKIWQTLI